MLELDSDSQIIADQVGRLATQRLSARRERPETVLDGPALAEFAAAAEEMGLIGDGSEDDYGLWFASDRSALSQGVAILRTLAAAGGDAALHVHWEALSARAAAAPDNPAAGDSRPWLWLAGGAGWPAESLVAWYRGEPDETARRQLRGWWAPEGAGLLFLGPPERRTVLLPAIDADGAAFWSLRQPPETADENPIPLHAPEGWSGRRLPGGAGARPRRLAELRPERWFELWALAGVGLLAIGLGILDDLDARAREYARDRRQGGVAIRNHAAVQQLLAELSLARHQGEAHLNALLAPADEPLWYRAARARAILHPPFCRAANAAMQVHGGTGYMRDTGIERGVRMQNALRCLNGTPLELRRLTAIRERDE